MERPGPDASQNGRAVMPQTVVAMIGYGRFGRALTRLFLDAGLVVQAYDSQASIPVTLAASSLESLVRNAHFIVLAVPISEIRSVIQKIAPFLDDSQIVLDVASVKVAPVQVFADILANRIPWVGTHPLFGPTSLALAEKPLRVVVCPNAAFPGATQRVKTLYEMSGCEVVEENAEIHDRQMAETHALAFFVAKGILESKMGLDVPYAPPSFQAITRTVDVVRADAGHLFASIQRENPYAAEARKKFIGALLVVDSHLRADVHYHSEKFGPSRDLAIADSPSLAPDLRETRELIDDLDRELLAFLARRMELAKRACRAKLRLGLGIVDQAREAELLERRRTWADEVGLDAEGVAEIFAAIVSLSRRLQQREP
jgi:prephenate dehydrogenase